MYGLRKSWLAAQITRFTASGAEDGAAAFPARRRARFPGTVGPEVGKVSALTCKVTTARTAALIRILGLKGSTGAFSSVSYAIKTGVAKKKITSWRPLLRCRVILAREWASSYFEDAVGTAAGTGAETERTFSSGVESAARKALAELVGSAELAE